MRNRSLLLFAFLLLLMGLMLTACRSDPTGPAESSPSTETESPPETAAETETDPPVAESETVSETETVPETEPPVDGIFESPTRLSGFTQDKNEEFFKGGQCEIAYNEDGSLTLKASAGAGKHYSAKLTVDYEKLMKNCLPSYTTTGDLPNGGEDKYRAVIITVAGTVESLTDLDLYYTTGRRGTTEHIILPLAAIPTAPAEDGQASTLLVFDMGEAFTEEYTNKLEFTWAYGTAQEEMTMEMKLESIDLYPTVQDACTELGLELPEKEEHGNYPLDISIDKLNPLIADIFAGDTVKNETVMFLDAGDEKELLYDIDTVISVTSYDGKKTYKEGVDYAVRDGKLVALEGTSMPIITRKVYYGAGSDSLLITLDDEGKRVYTHWGEGQVMTNWQVNVSYTHKDPWEGFDQPCEAEYYANFIRKLQNGEDVTVIFYGDSCTYGAASSFSYGYAPHQYSYAILVTEALADLFGYTVKYVSPNLSGTGPIPSRNYVAGTNGTITYINPSVGGWASADALANADRYLVPFIERYGCDLFISDIGGNDGSTPSQRTRQNVEGIVGKVLAAADEDVSVCIMSTLVNNPDSVNGWYGPEFMQEPQLRKAAAQFREQGISCGNCCVTSMTLSVLEHVKYNDISGNNINHPNDFWARMYACTLFENLIGYSNLK